MKRLGTCCFIVLLGCAATNVFAADQVVRDDDRVAVIGDSITEQKIYSAFIEEYLLMCKPAANVQTRQFGWGGETSWGFADRMDNDVLVTHPTLATTCYGMNDGGYAPLAKDRADQYREKMTQIVKHFKESGVRTIVVGSPGCVDSDKFGTSPGSTKPDVYNKTLGELRDIAKEVAEKNGCPFADVHQVMMDVMDASKKALGHNYAFAGGDGVHPGPNGHLAMAYAFLKAMGCDGDVGTITVDWSEKKAIASEGHSIESFGNGAVAVKSTRYPFCFPADSSPEAARTVLPYLPFNQDLNRFTLVVRGLSGKAKVTWGGSSKTFDAEQLAKGVNLADEFLDNPFLEPFMKVQQAVLAQQAYETPEIKDLIHNMPNFKRLLPDESTKLGEIEKAALAKDDTLVKAAADAVTPVEHTIKIEPAQ